MLAQFQTSSDVNTLFYCARKEQWPRVFQLIQSNPRLGTLSERGPGFYLTLTDHAYYQGRLDIVFELRNRNIYQAPQYTVVCTLMQHRSDIILQALTNEWIHINTQYQVGGERFTLIDLARNYNPHIVRELRQRHFGLSMTEVNAFALARRKDWNQVFLFLEYGQIDIYAKEKHNEKIATLMDYAKQQGNPEVEKKLQQYLPSPPSFAQEVPDSMKMKSNIRAMFLAATNNEFDKVCDYLDKGVHEDFTNPIDGELKGQSLLEIAYHHRNRAAFLILLHRYRVDIKVLEASNYERFQELMAFESEASDLLKHNFSALFGNVSKGVKDTQLETLVGKMRHMSLGPIGGHLTENKSLPPSWEDTQALVAAKGGITLLNEDFPDINFPETTEKSAFRFNK